MVGEVGEDVEVGEQGDDGRGEEHDDGGGEGTELAGLSDGRRLSSPSNPMVVGGRRARRLRVER